MTFEDLAETCPLASTATATTFMVPVPLRGNVKGRVVSGIPVKVFPPSTLYFTADRFAPDAPGVALMDAL